MKIYLLRHGETAYNAQGRYLGRTDPPLSERGRRKLGRAEFAPETVYISPLRRTAETADILFPHARQIVVPDFREMDFGVFEGKSYLDMEHFQPYRDWVDGGCQGQIPEGESMAAFSERTCAAFEALMNQAALERFALPRRDYFSWCGPLGGGFVLDGAHWREERTLTLLDTVRYTGGEEG